MQPDKPLILITNDDGIDSPGLHAAVRAALPLGEPVVAAPARQWSGSGRSLWVDPAGQIRRHPLVVDGRAIPAYEVGASPAVVVLHGLLELVPRRPALVISGINYGENVGTDITGSGTIGATLQAASAASHAWPVRCRRPKSCTPRIADRRGLLRRHPLHPAVRAGGPAEAYIRPTSTSSRSTSPSDATPETPWRSDTRLSPLPTTRPSPLAGGSGRRCAPRRGCRVGLDYAELAEPERTEPDSDIYALRVDRVVSVAPLSLDLTSRVDPREFRPLLQAVVGS